MYLRIEVPVVGFSALGSSEKAGPVGGVFFNKVLYSTDPHLGLAEIYEMLKCDGVVRLTKRRSGKYDRIGPTTEHSRIYSSIYREGLYRGILYKRSR